MCDGKKQGVELWDLDKRERERGGGGGGRVGRVEQNSWRRGGGILLKI